MASVIIRDGVRYKHTSIDVKEDLHTWAKENGVNLGGLLNKALDDKSKKK